MQRRIGKAREAFEAATAAASDAPQRRAVSRARAGFERWVLRLDVEIATFRNGDHHNVIAATLGPDRDARKAYERSLAAAQALGTKAVDSHSGTFATTASRSVKLLTGWLVFALVIGAVVAVWLMRSIVKPLYSIRSLLATLAIPPEPTR
jgi:hypothetical protein